MKQFNIDRSEFEWAEEILNTIEHTEPPEYINIIFPNGTKRRLQIVEYKEEEE